VALLWQIICNTRHPYSPSFLIQSDVCSVNIHFFFLMNSTFGVCCGVWTDMGRADGCWRRGAASWHRTSWGACVNVNMCYKQKHICVAKKNWGACYTRTIYMCYKKLRCVLHTHHIYVLQKYIHIYIYICVKLTSWGACTNVYEYMNIYIYLCACVCVCVCVCVYEVRSTYRTKIFLEESGCRTR